MCELQLSVSGRESAHVRQSPYLVLVIWILLLFMAPPPAHADCFYAMMFNLQNADCSDRGYRDISKGMDSTIQVLDFSENLVTLLDTDEFRPYPKLQEIMLSFNQIESISIHAFRGLFTLQTLHLESNKIDVIPSDSFRQIISLRTLNLKGNQIRVIEENSFQYLTNIETLILENNYIEYIHPKAFHTLDSLYELNLANNELKTLNSELGSFLPASLNVFRIHKNPWWCDCNLRWLRNWLAEPEEEVDWHFASDIPQCDGPPLIHDVNWQHLDADQFACAARIVSNSTTTYQVALRGNITIECEVHGDPEPKITWEKGSTEILNHDRIYQQTVSKAGVQYYVSTLRLMRIQPQDISDYKCIAMNNAGRSEVTYKLWADGFVPPDEKNYYFEILLGLGGGGLIIILLLLITLCCLCRKKDRSKREYKVREYRSPNGDRSKQIHSPDKQHKDNHTKQRVNNRPDGQCDRAKLLTGETQLLPDKSKQDISAGNTQQPNTHQRHTGNPMHDNQFNMKIFASYDRAQDDITLETGQNRSPDQAQSEADSRGAPPEQSGQNTPDLLKDGGSSMLPSPRAIPVPPPVVPCHLSSALTHPRAEENPYVKPSELRSQTMRRKTASADDLLDSAAKNEDPHLDNRRNSRSRDDLESLSRYEKARVDIPDYATTSRLRDNKAKDHASTCKNPVCLRDPNLGLDNESDPKGKVRSPSGTPLGLSTMSPREIDVDNMRPPPESRAIYSGDSHNYKTLPSRLHKQHSRDQYSPPNNVSQASPTCSPMPPSAQRTPGKSRPSHTKTVSFSEQGHPIIDLTQEMPDPIVISSQRRQPAASSRGVQDFSTYSTPRHAYSSTLPQAAMRGPVNISGVVPSSHNAPAKMPPQAHKAPLPNGSPARRPPQARVLQSTTLDDLLSPPFGHVSTSVPRGMQGSKTLPHKRKTTPKPGEKDEFGTAV